MSAGSRERGFTLVEVIVVVAVIAILAAILTPYVTKYIDDSRVAKAKNETQVIAAAITSFYKDVGRWPNRINAANNYNGLYTGTAAPTAALLNGAAGWAPTGATWNAIDGHLWTNSHGYPPPNTPADQKWQGPYATQLPLDPWGNPYIINAQQFIQVLLPNQSPTPVWVMSAGPNGKLNTPVASTATVEDDIGFRIR